MNYFNYLKNRVSSLKWRLHQKQLQWHNKSKIVVIQSDDWGSQRFPSLDVFNKYVRDGYPLYSRFYDRYDFLESPEDVTDLFSILKKYKDLNDNHPVITANYIVANPDYNKILENNFTMYNYETIDNTYRKLGMYDEMQSLLKYGIQNKIFIPQFHGREHLNVMNWMYDLQNRNPETIKSFYDNMTGIVSKSKPHLGNPYMVAYSSTKSTEHDYVSESIKDGLQIFERIFGYKARSFIAPCYTWDENIEKLLSSEGVKFIQSGLIQKDSLKNNLNLYHYTGEKNRNGQTFIVRNVFFEPFSVTNKENVIENALRQIDKLFVNNLPVVISTHRVNYIGKMSSTNKEENLQLLDLFLNRMLLKWPDIEFLSTEDFGSLLLS